MWLARLFGGRTTDDSEPSKFPPHPAANAAAPAQAQMRPHRSATPGIGSRTTQKAKGFDPYNSGAFRKASAWERVAIRR